MFSGIQNIDSEEKIFSHYESRKLFVNWPDMKAISVDALTMLVDWCRHQIIEGEVLQIGCIGAHGRTGTLLAAILIREGATAEEAIKKVRSEYCTRAIESKAQENLLTTYEETFLEEENR